MRLATIWTLTILGLAAPTAFPAVTFDESIAGDLSDDRLAPTVIVLSSGLNRIRGTFGPSPVPEMHDLDYAAIVVPEGTLLDAFHVVAADVGGAFSFLGIEAGPIASIPWDWTSIESPLFGWAHFGSSSVGRDLLPELGSAPGAIGFSGPLPAGIYTLWIMELDMGSMYSWDFGLAVTAVPAPGTAVLLAAMLRGPSRRRR